MTCRQCQSNFELTTQAYNLLQRFAVPNPTLCPSCRLQRRYNMRNERVLYNRTCDAWDQFKFGQEPDFTQPFFKQLKSLQLKQPRLALLAKDSENSDYTNHSAFNKDCYLGFSIIYCETFYQAAIY